MIKNSGVNQLQVNTTLKPRLIFMAQWYLSFINLAKINNYNEGLTLHNALQ